MRNQPRTRWVRRGVKNGSVRPVALVASLEFFSKKIDEYDKEVKDLKQTVKSLEKSNQSLKGTNSELVIDLSCYKMDLENLQQYNNRNRNVQIEGIPEANGESMEKIVEKLSEITGEPINFNLDVQAVHRIPTKRPNVPKPIVLQLTNRQKRDSLLRKSKIASKTKEIKSTDFVPGVPRTNVYVNEHLTPYFRNLFYYSKKLRESGFKFVWISEGKIFVKKTEDDRKIRISVMEDLQKLGLDINSA
ncbi:hypothetical protein J6590_030537 [Homalodisca vitripennis]|nr:hypothetical protein J6590_030537 [Homalodisca vitripennis]